jgi:hypothetical protein
MEEQPADTAELERLELCEEEDFALPELELPLEADFEEEEPLLPERDEPLLPLELEPERRLLDDPPERELEE